MNSVIVINSLLASMKHPGLFNVIIKVFFLIEILEWESGTNFVGQGARIGRPDSNADIMLYVNGRPLPARAMINLPYVQIVNRQTGQEMPFRIIAKKLINPEPEPEEPKPEEEEHDTKKDEDKKEIDDLLLAILIKNLLKS